MVEDVESRSVQDVYDVGACGPFAPTTPTLCVQHYGMLATWEYHPQLRYAQNDTVCKRGGREEWE